MISLVLAGLVEAFGDATVAIGSGTALLFVETDPVAKNSVRMSFLYKIDYFY